MDRTEQLGKLSDIFIILAYPQLPENIGIAARAMANTGILNFRLISPKCGWPNEKINLASAEKLHLLHCEIFDSLEAAVSDLQYVYATSARKRNMIEKIYSPENAASEIVNSNEKIGIVFGNEKSGLTNEDISLCNGVIEIPSVNFSSYNLAQSVLVVCFSILQMLLKNNNNENLFPKIKKGKSETASHEQLEFFLKNLEKNLEKKNHFSSADKQVQMMRTIRNFFKRSRPTSQEVQSLFGVMNSLLKR